MVDVGVQLERNHILEDERYWIGRYGEIVKIYFNQEVSVTRDSYNSIKNSQVLTPTVLEMKAYPVTYNPSKNQMEKAGIQEQVEVMFVTAMKDWTLNGIDVVKDFNTIKGQVVVRGETYNIVDKAQTGHIADTYSTITIGISRK